MERWTGKVALVTGASSGIGRELVRSLSLRGVRVIAVARRVQPLKDLEKESDGFVKGLQCDVRSERDIKSVFKWAEENWGGVSILVNNAGYLADQPLQDCETEVVKAIFETNVIGLTTFAREAVHSMKSNNVEEGHIININSYVGHLIFGVPGFAPYCASKNAVTVLTECLRRELGIENDNIKVTSLSPGLTETEMTTGKLPPEKPRLKASDVSDTILYVLSTPPGINITELTVMKVGDVIF